MLSKFSVKKPYTVVVGIVLVLILAVVSVTKMSTDLLPSMNLPYAIVVTTDMGASPEEVEKEVSAPIEAAMASMTDIKKVQSVSRDNYSMVVLQFEQSANMDAITVEMRESLDTLSAQWDDSVGSPSIMKINPDMMPVLISAVSVEGMSAQELTEYVDNNVVPEVERVDGVASVSVAGGVKTTIQVTMDSDKIEKLNKDVKKSLDKEFASAKGKVNSAKSKLNSQNSKISSGKDQLIKSTSETINQLTDQKTTLLQTKTSLQEKILEMKGSLTGEPAADEMINKSIAELEKKIKEIDKGIKTINENLAKINEAQISGAVDMGSASAQIASGKSSLDEALTSIEDSEEQAYDAADLTKILTIETLEGMITAQNLDMPAGTVEKDGEKYVVRVGDDIPDIEALNHLVLLNLNMDGVKPIYLDDIATVEYVDDSSDVYTSINGESGILLTIGKQTGYSTADVSGAAIKKLASIEKTNDKLHADTIMDQGIYINYVVDSVVQNMIVGGILAILILLLFLRDVKPTLVVACSIPVSVVTAIVLMYFSGVTLNVISLSGLALGIGMLVDNSIVVIENIYRLRNLGMGAKEAAMKGAKQVTGAIIASTLTTACVFLPIVFTDGITRQLFVDMGLTIAYSLLASLIIALTFVPMMSAGVLSKNKEKEHRILNRIQDVYKNALGYTLRFKPLVLLLALVLLLGSGYAAISRGTSFMPAMESTQMTATLKVPKGMELEKVKTLSDTYIKNMLDIEDVESVGAMSGESQNTVSMGQNNDEDSNQVTMYLILKEDKKMDNADIAKEIKKKTKDLQGELEVETSAMDISSYISSGIQIQVKGRDLEKMETLAKEVKEIVKNVDGTQEVKSDIDTMTKGVDITVDKKKAAKYSLTVAGVYKEISAKMSDAKSATTIHTDAADYEVYVKSDEEEKLGIDDIENIKISYTNRDQKEKQVSLKKIATVKEASSLSKISRDAQNRYISVTADIAEGKNVGLVSGEIQKEIKKLDVPKGYSIEMAGEDQTIDEAMEQLMLMLLVAVAFIYLIMVAQFQSLLSPFIIMFTIPLAFTGGFLGLYLTGSDVSVIAVVGFVMLSGIIVNNGIVLVDYINQLRSGGMTKKEAIVEAGRTRLRPIMMTALTTILAMSTMAMGMGMGADMVQPMAVVTIGGLIYGTLLTLFVVPCIYDLFHREKPMNKEEDNDLELLQ
ncbi:MAG: efflux RND transporter permease subunit [Lachnospiraceae bacterium]|nr:efflux RND transporter permease subunit [Lachnospiraceae bacterium]